MEKSDIVEALVNELVFTKDTAVAYVRARGRCEYCGTDLVMSRIGYAIAEIDHLLPQSEFATYRYDTNNFVLACRICNGVKGNASMLKNGEDAGSMLSSGRDELIDRAREYIRDQMTSYNRAWRKATEILHDVWWG